MLPPGWAECQGLWDSGAFASGYGLSNLYRMQRVEVMPVIERQLERWAKEGMRVAASLDQIWSYLEVRWVQAGLRSPQKTKIDELLESERMNSAKREQILADMQERFCDIVQYARSADLPERAATLAARHPEMVSALKACPDNWQHGFNSGCLAAFRLALAVAFGSKAEAEMEIESFPNLDT